jgi:uncharacterized membrane protein
LRLKAPDQHRPFRIPLSVRGLFVLVLVPVIVFVIALTGAFAEEGKMFIPATFAVSALVSAEVAWQLIIWKKRRNC